MSTPTEESIVEQIEILEDLKEYVKSARRLQSRLDQRRYPNSCQSYTEFLGVLEITEKSSRDVCWAAQVNESLMMARIMELETHREERTKIETLRMGCSELIEKAKTVEKTAKYKLRFEGARDRKRKLDVSDLEQQAEAVSLACKKLKAVTTAEEEVEVRSITTATTTL